MMKVLQISFMFVFGMLLFNGVHAQAPVVTSLSPQDNAEGVSPQVNLVMNFDVPVQKGEGTIEIRQIHDDALFETIDVNSSRVTLSGTAESAIINPANNFSFSTRYYVQVSPGAFKGLADEPFSGILSKTVWNFSTGCSAAPEGLTAPYISNVFSVLAWEGVPGISEYQIWVSGKGTYNVTDGSNQLAVTGLIPGSTYSWNIKSVCRGVGYTTFSGVSNMASFTTTGTNPCNTKPTIQATTNITNTSVRLNWSSKTGVSDYQVWVSGIGTFYTTNGLNYLNLTGLAPGSTYSYSLKAKCSDPGRTTFSPAVTGQFSTTGSNPCDSDVTGLTATTEENTALLEWTAIPGVTDYQLWVSGIGTIYSTSGQNNYLVEGLAPGSTYSWNVKSKCQATGRTLFSDNTGGEFTTSGQSICGQAPRNLIVTNLEANSVSLAWDDMGASDYQIWVSGIGTIFSTGGQNSYTLEGLVAGSTYTWKVKSKCSFTGRTSFSSNATGEFTTTGESICAQAPENLSTINIGNDAVILQWDDMGASDYQIYISGIGPIYSTSGQNSYLLEGLDAGTTYTWQIKSKCQWTGRTTFSPNAIGVFSTPEPLDAIDDEQPSIEPEEQLAEEEVIVQETSEAISMYPNPSNDLVTIAVDGDDRITSIIVFNSKGESLKEMNDLNSTSEIISLGTYGSGIYLIRVVINNNQMITERAIIQ